jgi:hypothetical protein
MQRLLLSYESRKQRRMQQRSRKTSAAHSSNRSRSWQLCAPQQQQKLQAPLTVTAKRRRACVLVTLQWLLLWVWRVWGWLPALAPHHLTWCPAAASCTPPHWLLLPCGWQRAALPLLLAAPSAAMRLSPIAAVAAVWLRMWQHWRLL